MKKGRRLLDLNNINRLDALIRRNATGNPEELAERLEMSRSSMFELIAYLKEELNAPIVYDHDKRSYVYTFTPKFHLGFEHDNSDPK